MTPPSTAAVALSLWWVEQRSEALVAVEDTMVVIDHQTGIGPDVIDALRAAPPTDLHKVETGSVVEVHLRAHHDHWVTVESSLSSGPLRWPRRAVIDHLVGLLTRHRLDTGRGGARLHAGAASDPSGNTAVVVGSSGSGKSTMVAHLAAAGLEVLTDEQLTLHADQSHVAGFTRPIAVKAAGLAWFPLPTLEVADGHFPTLVPVARLGARHRLTGRPRVLFFLERDGADPASAKRLTPSEALAALGANNLDLVRSPEQCMRGLAWLAATVPSFVLRYGSTDAGSRLVRSMLDEPREEAVPWQVTSHGPSIRRGSHAPAPGVIEVALQGHLTLFEPRTRGLAHLDVCGSAMWHQLRANAPTDWRMREFADELHSLGFVTGAGSVDD